MLTTTQYEYLDRDKIVKGVWNTIELESPVIKGINFQEFEGNALQYNVELTMPTMNWGTTGQPVSESTGTFEQRTIYPFFIIGDAYTAWDKIKLNATQNPETVDIEAKSKAMAHTFEKGFIMGQTSTSSSAKEPKGLMRMLAEMESATTTDLDGAANQNSQVIPESSGTSGALTMTLMDKLLNQIRPRDNSIVLMMSRLAQMKLNTLSRASGSGGLYIADEEKFGVRMQHYDGVPILINDWVPDNLPNMASSVLTISTYDQAVVRTTDYDNTIIFAFKMGDTDVTAFQKGGIDHSREEFIQGLWAVANRFAWIVSFGCYRKYSLAAIIGVNPDT